MKLLKEKRLSLNLSLRQAANLLGITKQRLYQIEEDDHQPQLKTLAKFQEAYDMTDKELIEMVHFAFKASRRS